MALDIASEMRAFDSKDREFFNNLSAEDKKKFSTFLMIRWGSCVGGSADMQAYYLQSTNLRLNKNFFAINKTKHDQLNWLAATTVSPNMGNLRHEWISQKKREGSNSKIQTFLRKIYPEAKIADLELLERLNDPKVWKEVAESLGYDKKQIKAELG